MKIERLFIYCLLAGTSFLASCGSEDITDNPVETLPEGMYPLTFTATQGEVVAMPQSRVSEITDDTGRTSSKWTGGEEITVAIGAGGLGWEGTELFCTLNADGSVSRYSQQLYWQNTGPSSVSAWYSNIKGSGTMTSNPVSLSDQSTGLAYVLKTEEKNVTYNIGNGKIPLNFKHQLTKVRVKLEKSGTTADLTNATVKMKSQYTDCSISEGAVITAGSTSNGTITMHKPTTTDGYYEANIVPGTIAADCFEITAENQTVSTELSNTFTTVAGEMYTFTITVTDRPVEYLGPPDGGTFNISGGNVIIRNCSGDHPIVVEGNSTITISNVELTTVGDVMTINNGATVILNVEGTGNKFTSTDGAGIKIVGTDNVSLAGITINGKNKNESRLEVTAGSGAAIGFNNDGNQTSCFCGDIVINNIHLVAQGGSYSPAIGISALKNDAGLMYWRKYGKISINNSAVVVSSTDGAACIGTPRYLSSSPFFLEGISINSSIVNATAYGAQAACIGFGYTTGTAFVDKKEIKRIEFSNSTLELTTGYTNKVGFGDSTDDDSRKLTDGIWNNNIKVGDTGWNPQ